MQAILTNSIEVIFIIFIVSAIADFVAGLIRINTPAPKECIPQVPSVAMEESVQVVTLPDPWMYDTLAITSHSCTAVLPIPKLLLLPSAKAQEVLPDAPEPEEVTIPALTIPMPESNLPIIQKRKPGRPRKKS
jgi:hypothetical protein